VARQAGLDPSDGEARVVEVRGKAEPVAVRVLTASVLVS
jgi:hypothetical protein